jgi:1-acyl-sn-glycerol-3-phosphate acyltransferase
MTLWYRLARPLARGLIRILCGIRVTGLEHIPREGPFVLVPNHQSILDPVVVQAFCPRLVHSMTKSTQFAGGFSRWLMTRLHGFPVRRYRIDPQSVRMVLRRLENREGVCVYPEGERSWDGTVQPFRRGTIRVLLRAGVPVIPVGIDGAWDVWPRWRKLPRVGVPMRLRFGRPLDLGTFRDREARERALPEANRILREALLELSGEATRGIPHPKPAADAAPSAGSAR